MHRILAFSIVLAAASFMFPGGPAAARDDAAQDDAEPVGGETTQVIVELVDLDIPGDASVLAGLLDLENEGIDPTVVLDEANLMAAEVTRAGLLALERAPSVESVRPAREDLRLLLEQSAVTVGAAALQLSGSTGAGRAVAVIDSGVDVDHPGLVGSVVEQGCFQIGRAHV